MCSKENPNDLHLQLNTILDKVGADIVKKWVKAYIELHPKKGKKSAL